MTHRLHLPILLCGLVPTLVAAVLCVNRPAFVSSLEYGVYDALVRSARTTPPGGHVVVVGIDDKSLSAFGQWPWRRDVIARLVTGLRELGASAIALDVIFPERDRQEGTDTNTDAVLADTFRSGRVVLGYAMTFDAPAGSEACARHPLGLAIVHREDEPGDPFFRATGAVCSLPGLTEAAGASGFLNAAPDSDGRLRRVPLLLALGGRVYPGLALAAVAAASGTHDMTLRVVNANSSWLMLGRYHVPLDGRSNLLLRFRGPRRTFPYVSAADVLGGRASAEAFKDTLVFVGTTALGTRDVVSTPLDTLFAGVEVQATVADNLLQQDSLYRPEHGVAIETGVVLVLGVVTTRLVAQFGLAWGLLPAAACLAALWGGAAFVISRQGAFFSPLFPSIGLLSASAAMTVAGLTTERRRADRAGVDKARSRRLMIQTLLSLTEVRDAETGRHSRRTQQYARVLAEQLATDPGFREYLTPDRIELLSALAPLHDIGKVGIPDRLLQKPGPLTPEELEEMRKHPGYGHDVLANAERDSGVHDDVTLAMAKDIAYTHHEKWDGTGYPRGLRGTEIPVAGRLMAVVDVYDATTTRRLYVTPMSQDDAIAFIVKGSGTHFDPAVVEAFLKAAPQLRHLSEDRDRPDRGVTEA